MADPAPATIVGTARPALHRRGLGEEPDALLVEDVPLLVTVAAWATTCAIVLALG